MKPPPPTAIPVPPPPPPHLHSHSGATRRGVGLGLAASATHFPHCLPVLTSEAGSRAHVSKTRSEAQSQCTRIAQVRFALSEATCDFENALQLLGPHRPRRNNKGDSNNTQTPNAPTSHHPNTTTTTPHPSDNSNHNQHHNTQPRTDKAHDNTKHCTQHIAPTRPLGSLTEQIHEQWRVFRLPHGSSAGICTQHA